MIKEKKKIYLTTSDASEICGVTRFTILNWINSRNLKSFKTAGGHKRILREDLMKFLNRNKTEDSSKQILHKGIFKSAKMAGVLSRYFFKKVFRANVPN